MMFAIILMSVLLFLFVCFSAFLCEQLKKAEKSVEEKGALIVAKNQTIERITKQIDELQLAAAKTAAERDRLIGQRNHFEEENKMLRRQADRADAAMVQMIKECDALKKENNDLLQEVESLRMARRECESQTKYKEEFQYGVQKCAQLTRERDALQEKLDGQTKEMAKLHKCVDGHVDVLSRVFNLVHGYKPEPKENWG